MRMRSTSVFVVVSILAALASCTRNGGSTIDLSSNGTGPPSAGTGSVIKWLGVVRTAADPNDLDADTTAVGAIVGGSIVVSPAACFDGLPARFAGDSYVLGVVAPTKQTLDVLLTTLGRPVLFEGQITTMCLD
ncbi:MAG: hypothetical protein ACRDH7_01450 [Actinomycetota bacterium]